MTNKDAAISVIDRLTAQGHSALLAGGCVRDMLLSRQPKDYDVATNAKPAEVIKLFKRTLEVGAKFGVVMVLLDDQQIEVATFRTESGYSDGRHPANVQFADAKADASRRDFTINGMFYDPKIDTVLDYVNGKDDLAKQIIRTIGSADERFSEDYLRMLRAVRFSAQLDFEIEEKTFQAVCDNAQKIKNISGERIAAELESMLVNKNAHLGASQLCKTGLTDAIFENFTSDQQTLGLKVLNSLGSPGRFILSLACLFAACDTNFIMNAVKILKLSNADTKHFQYLLENRSTLLDSDMSLADLKITLASGFFDDLFSFQTAIQNASDKTCSELEIIKQRAKQLDGINLTPDPLLDGNELMSLGVPPGPTIGTVSRQMYRAQLNECLTDSIQAKQWVKNWLEINS